MFDQRGTGAGALDCPALQRQMGASDLTVPAPAAVRSCAAAIGPDRRFYATADTVADIEALRAALGVARLTVDGVSYGSYVAERFALAHPGEVSRLVLDSVVPSWNVDPLQLVNMRQSAAVLRDVCAAQRCGFDPASDLATVVRRYHDGPALLDMLVALSVGDPSFPGVPAALHAAAAGHPDALTALMARVRAADAATAGELSQGLHASALCADMPMPWGGPDTPLADRPAALARAVDRLTPAQVWPFDRATAAGNGFIQTCLNWPPSPARPQEQCTPSCHGFPSCCWPAGTTSRPRWPARGPRPRWPRTAACSWSRRRATRCRTGQQAIRRRPNSPGSSAELAGPGSAARARGLRYAARSRSRPSRRSTGPGPAGTPARRERRAGTASWTSTASARRSRRIPAPRCGRAAQPGRRRTRSAARPGPGAPGMPAPRPAR